MRRGLLSVRDDAGVALLALVAAAVAPSERAAHYAGQASEPLVYVLTGWKTAIAA